MALANGVYRFNSKLLPTSGADVDNSSQSPGANIKLYHMNDTNAQKWYLRDYGSAGKSATCLASGLCMDANGNVMVDGTNIYQWTPNSTTAQRWIFTEYSGYYKVASATNQGFCLDLATSITTDRNNIQLWHNNDTDAQRWQMMKDTYLDTNLTVPAAIALTSTPSGTAETISIVGTAVVYPTWIGGPGEFQLRYRTNSRFVGKETWAGYNQWRSPSGSTANEGWGDPWSATASDNSLDNNRHYVGGLTLTVDQVLYDQMDVQIEVRRFQTGGHEIYGNVHGLSSTGIIRIYYQPMLSISAVKFSPGGLGIQYSSTYKRKNNKMTITAKVGSNILVSGFGITNLDYTGSFAIPIDELKFIPKQGDTITMDVAFTSEDNITDVFTASKIVTYETGYYSLPSVSFTPASGYSLDVDPGEHDNVRVWMVVDNRFGRTLKESEFIYPGYHRVYPPLNQTSQVCVLIEDGSRWAIGYVNTPKIQADPAMHIWNYDANEYTILLLDVSYDQTVERSYEAYQTSGRDTEVVSFGTTSKVDLSVNGHIVPEFNISHAGYNDFHRLSLANYATYRNPLGGVYRVAIVSVSDQNEWTRLGKVQIDMKENS